MQLPYRDQLSHLWGKFRKFRRHHKKYLGLASQIIGKLPSKGDRPATLAVKAVAILDSFDEVDNEETGELQKYLSSREMVGVRSDIFTKIFWATSLKEEFESKQVFLDKVLYLEATSPKHGTILFQPRNGNIYYATFYVSKSLSLDDLVGSLWDACEGHMQLSCGYSSLTFGSFTPVPHPLYGLAKEAMNKLVHNHRRYLNDKVARAYMFYGQPGTGKTSFAMSFTETIGTRTLRMDGASFSRLELSDAMFLVEALHPDFIIVDDMDKVPEHFVATILSIIQEVKSSHPKTTLIFTANNIASFDKGFLRPGRVDSWMCFDPPDLEQRKVILTRYLTDFSISPKFLESLAKISHGLTQDYLREVAVRVRYEEEADVLSALEMMRKLLVLGDVPVDDVKKETLVLTTATDKAKVAS